MKSKTVANCMIATLTSAIAIGILEDALSVELYDGLSTIVGLALITFGIWAIVKLYKAVE